MLMVANNVYSLQKTFEFLKRKVVHQSQQKQFPQQIVKSDDIIW